MKLSILRTALIVLLVIAGGGFNLAYAIDEHYAAPPMRGSQIRKDSFSVVEDPVFFNPALKPLQTTNLVRNLFTLRIDEASRKKLPDNFQFTLELKIYYKKLVGVNTVQDSTGTLYLRVSHNKNGTYSYRAIQTFKGGHEAKLVIKEVFVEGASLASFEDVLVLENEIFVDREYQFSPTANMIPAISSDASELATTGELTASWGKDPAADEYDLEWTYIDEMSLTDYLKPGDPTKYNADAIFLRNATRVSLTSTEYRIPLLYDMKGRLFFRVRAVQVKTDNQRVEANWSSHNYNVAGLGNFPFNGHDPDFNWQASTSFAEEGKRKSVVQYFDGSLRNRQTVTKDNTTNKTIIAESLYDYQGRPVIQVLPSPSISNIIKYTPRFNTGINGAEYEKDWYDKEVTQSDLCEVGAPPMDSVNSGAAHYYSGAFPLTVAGMHQYIPKAKGFPFTETRYLPDNTGRVSLQSGVAESFQIGNKATRYYYGTADQEELDALFGTEAGNNSHYFKNMVRDANGQYSISYVDMLGRTIATALAGDPPASLDRLASNDSVRVEKRLLDANNNIVKGNTIEASRGLIVTRKATHHFKYSLLPDSLTINDCQNLPVCYDCRYDLEITITDECGGKSFTFGKPIVIRRNNIALETNCGVIQNFPTVDTIFTLEEGNYLITKKLTINKSAMDYYRSVFLSRNTCKTFDSFLEEQRTALATLTCEPDCNSCTVQLGDKVAFRTKYFDAVNIPTDERTARQAEADLAYERLKRDCYALCNRIDDNQHIKEMMLADISPPYGQYANPDQSKIDQFSIFNIGQGGMPNYGQLYLIYRNEKGEREFPYSYPRQDFVNRFKSSWAETLLQLHPEYDKLVRLQQLEAKSHGWVTKFQQTETYQEAIAQGFLNPANFSGLPGTAAFAHIPANADSLFTHVIPTYKNEFKDSLDWKAGYGHESIKINAWSLATLMAHCKNGDLSCLNTFKPMGQAFNLDADCSGELDIAWKYFREFYLQERREVIQRILDGIPYRNGADPSGTHVNRFNFNPIPANDPRFPQNEADGRAKFEQEILNNCLAQATQWLEDLKPCNLTEPQRIEIINRMVQVCKEGGDAQHIFGASTVKPSSTLADRSFEQVLKSVLGSNYNSSCNVYLINSPKPYGKQPVLGVKQVLGKPDSCECTTINNLYNSYTNKRNGNELFSQYLYRTTKTVISEGALDTLRKSCNGQINCSFFPKPIQLPAILQCGMEDVCVDCNEVQTSYDKFKLEFPGVLPSKTDTSLVQLNANRLFVKYMNNSLGFSKTSIEYLEFLDQCNAAGMSCENLSKIRMDYEIIAKYDSTHFLGYPDTNSPIKLRDVYYKGWAHAPDSQVNSIGWGRRYGKLDTLCVGNEFTIETRIKRPARDNSNTIVDLNISFNQDGETQKIVPLFYFLRKDATAIDSAFVRSNSGKIGYVAAGDTIGQLVQTIPDFTDWKIIKVKHTADNYWRVYYNNVLVAERHVDSSVRKLLGFSVGFEGEADNGYVDYFKVYDANNVLQYVEEFEDHIQSPTNAPLAFRCEDACQTGFVKHFNNQMGTQFNYAQIDSLYQNKGCVLLPPCGNATVNRLIDLRSEFKNLYYNYGERRDVDGINTRMWLYSGSQKLFRFKDVIRNGVFQIPDTLNIPPVTHRTGYGPYRDTICTNGNFSMEMLMKFDGSGFDYHIYFGTAGANQKLYVEAGTNLGLCWIDYLDDVKGSLGSASNVAELHNLNMKEWTKVKWKFSNRQVSLYLNDTLRKTITCNADADFSYLRGWTVGAKSGSKIMPMALDWVKYYDGRDSVMYQEDFNDPYNLSRYHDSLHCTRKPCDEEFRSYYNREQSTNLSYSQIVQLYSSNNVLLDICESNLILCGRNEPTFPDVIPNQHQPCDDSTLFAVSTATLLHEYYRDSILSSFDDRYLAKCLEVKNTEQMTVAHTVNEYHYTLYYYDQAGNLVKTVPPSGVDVSKFQWASSWSDSVRAARNSRALLTPQHTLPTNYWYNTLNQVVEQKSPDGGRTEFWYDRLGRLAISQNEKQRNTASPGQNDWDYSYTKYDVLGRIFEVGQIKNLPASPPVTDDLARDKDQLNFWHVSMANRRSQITTTLYDIPYDGLVGAYTNLITQRNLRNRVSASFISEGNNPTVYNHATLYTYDIHGNVDKLLQDYGYSGTVPNIMNMNGNRFKTIEYDYDLISGKVNLVRYQPGLGDQFYHKYRYDAENRLTLVETSLDGFVWQKDARYEYYLHGPLARTVLGDQSVQGIDYAYTLQGWLKGVNSAGASQQHDIGGDGRTGSTNDHTARDAYGFSLNYFTGDYQPASNNVMPFPGYSAALGARYKPLYNGNISSMASSIRKFENGAMFEGGANLFFSYRYDQLNRLVSMDTDTGFNVINNSFAGLSPLPGFKERIAYDGNGNILRYFRSNKGAEPEMDSLTYKYYPGTNQLRRIADSVKFDKWGIHNDHIDIDSQAYENNYVYDQIGNLIKDSAENIWNIKWNVYGKIQEINRYATAENPVTKIRYMYDASGNRIGKVSETAANKKYTWYVRDGQGNILSVYTSEGLSENLSELILTQTERNIYGSSRLGTEMLGQGVDGGPWDAAQYYTQSMFERGRRQYELTNHLGNVLTTISDKKFGVSSDGSLIDYFEPDIVSGTEYYPFGMPLRGGGEYRFGFNGKENDNEVKGGGLQQDYGMRIYDPRLGKFLSVDPLTKSYPELTPYQFASNSPVAAIDLDGLEGIIPEVLKAVTKLKAPKVYDVLDGASEATAEALQGTWDFFKPDGGAAWQKSTWTSTGKNLLAMGFANNPSAAIDFDSRFNTDLFFRQNEIKQGVQNTISEIPNWDTKTWSKNLTSLGLAFLADKGLSKIKDIYLISKFDIPLLASSKGGLFAKAKDLKLGHPESTILKSSSYQKIKNLTDDELINSVLNPDQYNSVKINTKTGKLADGNTRIYEIQRRGLNVDVPLETHVPDDSMFPTLKEPPKK